MSMTYTRGARIPDLTHFLATAAIDGAVRTAVNLGKHTSNAWLRLTWTQRRDRKFLGDTICDYRRAIRLSRPGSVKEDISWQLSG